MPDQAKQPDKKSTEPSPGLLQRLFGSEEFSPEMQEGIRIAKQEMPNMAPVQPYGFFSRLVNPNVLAYVSPGKNIYLNPTTNQGQSPQDIADTLTHEQTHVNQANTAGHGPLMTMLSRMFSSEPPYAQRPDEMEAFQAEKDRRARMGRIQTAVPSFTSGEMYAPTDTYLPSPKVVAKANGIQR